jgi:two-component system, OmpR family, response regulator RpaA
MQLMEKALTTTECAKFLQVAPRTVCKWFDAGRLKGWRVLGSQDRRIKVIVLVRFMKDNGMPIPDALQALADAPV